MHKPSEHHGPAVVYQDVYSAASDCPGILSVSHPHHRSSSPHTSPICKQEEVFIKETHMLSIDHSSRQDAFSFNPKVVIFIGHNVTTNNLSITGVGMADNQVQGSRYRSPLSPFAQKNKIWHKKNHKLAKTSGEKIIA